MSQATQTQRDNLNPSYLRLRKRHGGGYHLAPSAGICPMCSNLHILKGVSTPQHLGVKQTRSTRFCGRCGWLMD